MPQTTILAAGTTLATSTDVVIAGSSSKKIGITCAGPIGPNDTATILEVTPLGTHVVMQLNSSVRSTLLGPGTYRVRRPVSTAAVAVYVED